MSNDRWMNECSDAWSCRLADCQFVKGWSCRFRCAQRQMLAIQYIWQLFRFQIPVASQYPAIANVRYTFSVTYLILFPAMKELWKSVKTLQNHCQNLTHLFEKHCIKAVPCFFSSCRFLVIDLLCCGSGVTLQLWYTGSTTDDFPYRFIFFYET